MTSFDTVSSADDDESMAFRIEITEAKLMLGIGNIRPEPDAPVSHLH
jgi:hypothetical protein